MKVVSSFSETTSSPFLSRPLKLGRKTSTSELIEMNHTLTHVVVLSVCERECERRRSIKILATCECIVCVCCVSQQSTCTSSSSLTSSSLPSVSQWQRRERMYRSESDGKLVEDCAAAVFFPHTNSDCERREQQANLIPASASADVSLLHHRLSLVRRCLLLHPMIRADAVLCLFNAGSSRLWSNENERRGRGVTSCFFFSPTSQSVLFFVFPLRLRLRFYLFFPSSGRG
jgi:hypothetical protein